MLGQLDYRCHTADHTGNITLPAKLSQCLATLSATPVDKIQVSSTARPSYVSSPRERPHASRRCSGVTDSLALSDTLSVSTPRNLLEIVSPLTAIVPFLVPGSMSR